MLHRLRFPNRGRREAVVDLVLSAYDTEEHEPLYDAAALLTTYYGLAPVRRFVFRRRVLSYVGAGCPKLTARVS